MATVHKSVDLKKLTEAAGRGDAKAQFDLGIIYCGGKGVVQDIDAAKKYLGMAADQGHVEALYQLSTIIERHPRIFGRIPLLGDEPEPTPTYEELTPEPDPHVLMEKAAELGHVKAQNKMARHYFDYVSELYHSAKGESWAENEPWDCVIDEWAYTNALKKGWDWVTKAAKNGDRGAQYKLASQYEIGLFTLDTSIIECDMAKAAKWYKKSAESNHIDAQYKMGLCYDEGKGVKQDKAEAVKWYMKAAERPGDSQYRGESQYKLGLCYGNGIGVEKDISKAVEWLQKAAEKSDHPAAKYELGHYYYNGRGVKEDQAKAMELWLAAAHRGHLDAQKVVYHSYSTGDGVKKDEEQAEYWGKRIEGIPIPELDF